MSIKKTIIIEGLVSNEQDYCYGDFIGETDMNNFLGYNYFYTNFPDKKIKVTIEEIE